MVEATATQFELIMHHVETYVVESFWENYKKNNKGTPSPTMQNFIQETIKWTVGETFKKIMVEIFDKE
jgi:hypothetical protein